jgi:inorganic pyrophosphatase
MGSVRLDQLPLVSVDAAVRVVVEANAGSRNKLKYVPDTGVFELHHVLPLGTCFPYDFGFLPSTLGGDGDPRTPSSSPTTGAAGRGGRLPPDRRDRGRTGQTGRSTQAQRPPGSGAPSHLYRDWHNIGDVPLRVLAELGPSSCRTTRSAARVQAAGARRRGALPPTGDPGPARVIPGGPAAPVRPQSRAC